MTGETLTTDETRATGASRSAGRPTTHAWLLVMRREIVVRATDRAFLVGTLVTIAVIAGVLGLQVFLAGRPHDVTLATTSADRSMAVQLAERAPRLDDSLHVTVRDVPDADAARALVRTQDGAAWLHEEAGTWTLTTRSGPDDTLEPVATQVVRDAVLDRNARAAGTSVEVLARGTVLATSQLEGDGKRAGFVKAVGFAFSMLFYTATLLFGYTLATSVVEEKQSRIVEIIVTAVDVRHLLAGKVAGSSVLALGQLLIYTAVGLVGLSFTPYASMVPSVSGPIVWFVVFFIVGYLALASLWAAAGALAARAEDVQSTASPLTMLMVMVFIASMSLDGTAQQVASFVPPLSIVIMPMRLLTGDAFWWEAVLALVLLLAASVGTVTVGARLYRRSILQSGGRVSLRSAWSTDV